jgi:hypothetical protein
VFAASRLSSEANERYDGCGVAFKVTGQAAIAADPRKSLFDDPSVWARPRSRQHRNAWIDGNHQYNWMKNIG